MLISLEIINFGLIEKQNLDFSPGLNIITGQTGSGKSTILEAINKIFDKKSDFNEINLKQTGKTSIEAIFTTNHIINNFLISNNIDSDTEQIILSREISSKYSKTKVNGSVVNYNLLQSLKNLLMSSHNQNENYNLLKPSYQLKLLDSFGDNHFKNLKVELEQNYKILGDLKSEYNQLIEKNRLINEKLDYIKFEYNELVEANLNLPNEDSHLEEQKSIIKNTKLITETLNDIKAVLGIIPNEEVISISEQIEKLNAKFNTLKKYNIDISEYEINLDLILSSIYELTKIAKKKLDYSSLDEYDLESIETRLSELARLKRKYNLSLENLIEKKSQLENQIEFVENIDAEIIVLENKIKYQTEKYNNIAHKISELRQINANLIEEKVQEELKYLDLKDCKFKIEFNKLETPNLSGIDEIKFLISPNPGLSLAPLTVIASGGELTRIVLALKCVFANQIDIESFIFDEIDTGISGETITKVGKKLKTLSDTRQVIAVTHQPSIAALAQNHLVVEKIQSKDSTHVKIINANENRLEAISALIGSKDDKAVIEFAKSLLNSSN